MEEPKNLKTGKRRASDVIDCLPCTNEHRIVSTPETIIGTQGPHSQVSLGYGGVDSGTPKSSVSPDSDAFPPPPKKLLEISQVDVTDASPMSQDNDISSK
jgi:hypothetical protein